MNSLRLRVIGLGALFVLLLLSAVACGPTAAPDRVMPAEPDAVNDNNGKPQLIKFYADW